MKYSEIFLKKGKEKSIRNRHPWVFSGAVDKVHENFDSPICKIYDNNGNFLGWGFYNSSSFIKIRVVSLKEEEFPDEGLLRKRMEIAWNLRKKVREISNGFRVVNSEGDSLPGLIIDYYNGLVVFQIRSLGMEFYKESIVESIKEIINPTAILEKNNFGTRKLENLPPILKVHIGTPPEKVEIFEYDWSFYVYIVEGQKTGFFLDQRENRKILYEFVEKGMKIANTFAYTGGFGIPASIKGANVVNVEISREALEKAKENYTLNTLYFEDSSFVKADVFNWLREVNKKNKKFDFVVLDPPAFAKTVSSVQRASRGYKDINLNALKIIREGGYLFTFSCSNHIDFALFQKIIFSAFKDAGREGKIIKRMGQSADHPINIYHPEGEYLKGLLIHVA